MPRWLKALWKLLLEGMVARAEAVGMFKRKP
jgi:hypothetical protein